MRIIMKYPFISGNTLCDGTRHVINPQQIHSFVIGDIEMFILTYMDEKEGTICETILRQNGSKFIKVPLRSYDEFKERIANGTIKLKPVDLSILDNVFNINTDEPVNNIDSLINSSKEENFMESQLQDYSIKKPEVQIAGPKKRGLVPIYIDETGNMYTRGFTAQAIFGNGGSSFYYPLTPGQVKYILENFDVEYYEYDKYGKNVPISDRRKLVGLLKAFCEKNKISNDVFDNIINGNTIYVVINSTEDEQYYRGKFNGNNLLSGINSFRYVDGKYIQCYSSSSPFIYLEGLTRNLKDGEYISVDSVEAFYDKFDKYEFVGGFDYISHFVEELKPLEKETDVKNTLSSAMLGYIKSECKSRQGVYVGGILQNTFDIKEVVEEAKKNEQEKYGRKL